MIITMGGYGKILQTKSAVNNSFKKFFGYYSYLFDDSIGKSNHTPFDNDKCRFYDDENYPKDTVTGIYKKCNHDYIGELININSEKKSLSYTEVCAGYHKLSNEAFLDGDFSSAVYDVFIFLKGIFPSEYEIILVKPEEKNPGVRLNESIYWGVSAYHGSFLFSNATVDNLPRYYGGIKEGYGVKFLVKTNTGTMQEAAKVDAIYESGKPIGVYFEINNDAIVSLKTGRTKALHGSRAYTDFIREEVMGDDYKEKMVDALTGIIGTYKENQVLDQPNKNYLFVYYRVVAAIAIIRNISENELRDYVESIMEGYRIKKPDLIDCIIGEILSAEESIISKAETVIFEPVHSSNSFIDQAVYKIARQNRNLLRIRNIKKPQA